MGYVHRTKPGVSIHISSTNIQIDILKCVLRCSFCQYTCFFLAQNSDLFIRDVATCYLFFNVFHQHALRHLPLHGLLLQRMHAALNRFIHYKHSRVGASLVTKCVTHHPFKGNQHSSLCTTSITFLDDNLNQKTFSKSNHASTITTPKP